MADSSPSDAGDLRLGKRAVDRGLITLEQLRDALVHHARLPSSDQAAASRFGLLLREYDRPRILAHFVRGHEGDFRRFVDVIAKFGKPTPRHHRAIGGLVK